LKALWVDGWSAGLWKLTKVSVLIAKKGFFKEVQGSSSYDVTI